MKTIPDNLLHLIQGEDVIFQNFEKSNFAAWAGKKIKAPVYLREVAIQESYTRLLEELAAPMAAAKVRPLVLGGVSLWNDCYDVGVRPVTDLDIWIPAEDESACHQVLKEQGFTQNAQFQMVWNRQNVEIDLHTYPLNSERQDAFKHLFTFDTADIYERAEPLPVCLCAPWRRPAGEDLFVQHALHAIKHEFERVNLVLDLHFILKQHLPMSELGKKCWAVCTPALKRLNCESPLSEMKPPRLALKLLNEGKQRPFLAGLRLLAWMGTHPWKFWWQLGRGNSKVHRESGGPIKRYMRLLKKL